MANFPLPKISKLVRRRSPIASGRLVSSRQGHRRLRRDVTHLAASQTPRKSKQSAIYPSHIRLLMVWGILLAGGLILCIKLFHLQVVQGPMLAEKAQEQQMIYLRPFVPRRPIVDRSGNVIAIDRPVYNLYAHPKLFKVPDREIATKLASTISLPIDDLLKEFKVAESGIRIQQFLPEDIADRVADLRLDGLELIKHQQRFYPQEELFADVVGYVNVDHKGQAGLEYSQENRLERLVRAVRLTRAGNGALMPDHVPGSLLHFDDLRLKLTLDSRLQRATRIALTQQVETYQAKRGVAMVMDARDGSILAMVETPSYNPNQFSDFEVELFKNWSLTDLYEPGSTFKPLNVAIALESGAIQPNSTFYDSGQITIGPWPIKNAEGGGRGQLTVAQILQYSSNVGMVKMMQRLQPAVYYGWLERLGLGHPVGVDLPSEASGQLKSQEEFTRSPIEPATTAFGQGFSLTPIQLLQLHGALANGGKLVTPHVVQGITDANGEMHWQPRHPSPRQIFSPATASTVVEMMENVVDQGTGKNARIPGYRIGGKTGTAQKASPGGGYYTNAKISSFVSILPVQAPRYVVLAVVDEPKGQTYGSIVAAPIAKSIMEALISIENIPPSPPVAQ